MQTCKYDACGGRQAAQMLHRDLELIRVRLRTGSGSHPPCQCTSSRLGCICPPQCTRESSDMLGPSACSPYLQCRPSSASEMGVWGLVL